MAEPAHNRRIFSEEQCATVKWLLDTGYPARRIQREIIHCRPAAFRRLLTERGWLEMPSKNRCPSAGPDQEQMLIDQYRQSGSMEKAWRAVDAVYPELRMNRPKARKILCRHGVPIKVMRTDPAVVRRLVDLYVNSNQTLKQIYQETGTDQGIKDRYCKGLTRLNPPRRCARLGSHAAIGAGKSTQGWYRGVYFRSLKELCYMIQLDERGEKWLPGEQAITIPYEHDEKAFTYRPDFVIGNRVVEVKPRRLQSTTEVLIKKKAAEEYCARHGLTYEFADVQVSFAAFAPKWLAGEIQFLPKCKMKMLAWGFGWKLPKTPVQFVEEEQPLTEYEAKWLAELEAA